MVNRTILVVGVVLLLAAVLLGCTMGGNELAGVTATPTKTPRPLFTATQTPTATPLPTQTPQPTDTPVPPTEPPLPTNTPIPATEPAVPPTEPLPPTDTAVPPTDTAVPPTKAPKANPTKTPAPPTNTPKPKVDFKVKEIVAFQDGSLTASGLHNIYFTVIDAGGGPIDGIVLKDTNNQPGDQVTTGNKGPGKTEFTMWAADYTFKVVSNTGGQTFSSETTHVLAVLFEHAVWDDLIRGGICSDEASCRALGPIHYSYNVTFQRTW